MSSDESITHWVEQARSGGHDTASKLWEAYFPRLVQLARRHLRDLPRRLADEEDVALSAFDSFWRGAGQGRFPRLDDRHDLWQVLVMITARKARDLIEHEGRAKRDWRRLQPNDPGASPSPAAPDLSALVGRGPCPACAAQVADQCRHLLSRLADEQLRVIALLKMDGYTNAEIAALLDLAPTTIERRLTRIRKQWEREGAA
jgi:RNA polymerase sigma factor (sigma-70 family)